MLFDLYKTVRTNPCPWPIQPSKNLWGHKISTSQKCGENAAKSCDAVVPVFRMVQLIHCELKGHKGDELFRKRFCGCTFLV